MDSLDMLAAYDTDTRHRQQMAFASLFILANRLQTAGEKIQTEITMKQWLMLAIASECPAPRTLSRVGSLMGCSRQNVKQLATALARKGFVTLEHGANNAVCIEPTEHAAAYLRRMGDRHARALLLLFDDFSEDETAALYRGIEKLYHGMTRMERYADGLD